MTSLHYPRGTTATDVQVWRNNAAFDNNGHHDSIFKDACSETLDFDSSNKENHTPSFVNSKSQGKPLKLLFKEGVRCSWKNGLKNETEEEEEEEEEDHDGCDDIRKIDSEIKVTEMEISRLSSKLEVLFLEKKEQELKMVVSEEVVGKKQNDEIVGEGCRTDIRRRGLSLGPEQISGGIRSRTKERVGSSISFQSRKNRRKSCFSKLQDIDEEKVAKGRGISLGLLVNNANATRKARVQVENTNIDSAGMSSKKCSFNFKEFNEDKVTKQRGGRSLSPEPRLPVSMNQALKRSLTSVGLKKLGKKDSGVLSSVQPKKLFKETELSLGSKKAVVRNGKVIASRFNGNQKLTEQRKRSLPEDNEEDVERCENKCSLKTEESRSYLQDSGLNQVIGTRRVKKRWEIPSEVIIHESFMESPPPSFSKMASLLPKIRTNRCTNGSPRDSGPAKRVVDLIGRKTYFGAKLGEADTSVCQALSYDEEEE